MTTTRTKERKQFLADVFTNAMEGGMVEAWADVQAYHWRLAVPEDTPFDQTQDLDGFYADIVEIGDGDEETPHHIDIDVISKGLNLILDGKVKLADWVTTPIRLGNRDNDAGDIDAICADAIVQAGLFDGEVIYG